MGVVVKAVEEPQQRLVDHRVVLRGQALRDGVHVRSPLRFDGVKVGEDERDRQVLEARVDRAANAHLSDLRAGDLAHRDHVARRVGLRDQRLQSVQLDLPGSGCEEPAKNSEKPYVAA